MRNVTHIIMNGRLFAWLTVFSCVYMELHLFSHCCSNYFCIAQVRAALQSHCWPFVRKKSNGTFRHGFIQFICERVETLTNKHKNKRKICWLAVYFIDAVNQQGKLLTDNHRQQLLFILYYRHAMQMTVWRELHFVREYSLISTSIG